MPLSTASVDKLIRKAGAHRVSVGASKELASHLEEAAIKVAREAITLAEHAGRKTVKAEDVKLALKRLHGF
ncbi:MAG: histone family protein [Theionarchaea archaeon]|nr:MAG: histone [Theionarchaea archaeon DG-70-1]MBU7029929.1 histone family protein [Theionarchaea archaeon]